MTVANDYAPGKCNIGPAEIRRRRRSGWVGTALGIGVLAAIVAADAAPAWYLALFFPAFIAAIGFLQAAFRFCVHFGYAALFNFSELGQRAHIVDPAARRLDRAQARRIVGLSALAAATVALTAFGLASVLA